MVAPLPSRVSLATEGPPCFGRVQQEGCPLLPVCCVCTKPHRIIVSRRGRGNLESSFVMPPTPPPDVCAVWTAQTCATGPPSSVLPTRHHCLFRTSGFLPRAKSESFAPPGPSLRNSLSHWCGRSECGVSMTASSAASSSSSRLRGGSPPLWLSVRLCCSSSVCRVRKTH